MEKYSYSVIIGRFNPCHVGHKELLDFALANGKKVIVLLGSSFQPRTIKNPFTWMERQLMIESMYDKHITNERFRFIFKPIADYTYNDQKWAMEVQNTIDAAIDADGGDPDEAKICLVGNNKDDSSWYLSMFPQFPLLTTPFATMKNQEILSATAIRQIMFETDTTKTLEKIAPYVHQGVLEYLNAFMKGDTFSKLVLEHYYIKDYKKSWEKAPYAPTFVCTDAICIQSGHVLLVQRRAEPGKGLWAFAGGFLNQNEYIEDAMIRELREETKLKVPDPVIRGSIKKVKVYDAPNRSLRGRTITHAFLIQFPDGILPRVKGSDDALKAKWIPLSDVKSEHMFEDHYQILQDILGL